jgi:molybdopterin converting factor small subunit
MRVNVVFYGGLKQDTGARQQALDLDANSLTVGELAEVLKTRFPALGPRLETVAYAVNDAIVDPGYVLRDGDEAGLLPPVSGG